MDPIVVAAAGEIATIAARTTAESVATRAKRARADADKDSTIQQLDEIINDLQTDRADLLRLAKGLEEQFVAQQLTGEEITYIAEEVLPIFTGLAGDEAEEKVEVFKKLLSVEVLTALQTIGFNYRRALGEPLTEIAREMLYVRFSPLASEQAPGSDPDEDEPTD